jgi:hypothetical protein
MPFPFRLSRGAADPAPEASNVDVSKLTDEELQQVLRPVNPALSNIVSLLDQARAEANRRAKEKEEIDREFAERKRIADTRQLYYPNENSRKGLLKSDVLDHVRGAFAATDFGRCAPFMCFIDFILWLIRSDRWLAMMKFLHRFGLLHGHTYTGVHSGDPYDLGEIADTQTVKQRAWFDGG